jgi:hypothetical protein
MIGKTKKARANIQVILGILAKSACSVIAISKQVEFQEAHCRRIIRDMHANGMLYIEEYVRSRYGNPYPLYRAGTGIDVPSLDRILPQREIRTIARETEDAEYMMQIEAKQAAKLLVPRRDAFDLHNYFWGVAA